MNNSGLPGLSPLWLICLALALGTTIVVLVPASIATGDAIKSSDWIGFAGSVIGGAMTLIAAIAAWFAVQKQITAQQVIAEGQIATQRIAILQDRLAILDNDDRIVWKFRMAAAMIGYVQQIYMPNSTATDAECEKLGTQFSKLAEDLELISTEFREAATRRRAISVAYVERAEISVAVSAVTGSIIDARKLLIQCQSEIRATGRPVLTPTFDINQKTDAVNAVCGKYLEALHKETLRLDRLISASAKVVGL